jgi:hypothetical protein
MRPRSGTLRVGSNKHSAGQSIRSHSVHGGEEVNLIAGTGLANIRLPYSLEPRLEKSNWFWRWFAGVRFWMR